MEEVLKKYLTTYKEQQKIAVETEPSEKPVAVRASFEVLKRQAQVESLVAFENYSNALYSASVYIFVTGETKDSVTKFAEISEKYAGAINVKADQLYEQLYYLSKMDVYKADNANANAVLDLVTGFRTIQATLSTPLLPLASGTEFFLPTKNEEEKRALVKAFADKHADFVLWGRYIRDAELNLAFKQEVAANVVPVIVTGLSEEVYKTLASKPEFANSFYVHIKKDEIVNKVLVFKHFAEIKEKLNNKLNLTTKEN